MDGNIDMNKVVMPAPPGSLYKAKDKEVERRCGP